MKRLLLLSLILTVLLMSCKQNIPNQQRETKQINAAKAKLKIDKKNAVIKGQKVGISFMAQDNIDSVVLLVNDSSFFSSKNKNVRIELSTDKLNHYGLNYIKANIYVNGTLTTLSDGFVLFPNKEPKWYTYKVKKVYPHDTHAYTQGLVYQDNILYESTGLKGQSSIRKEKLETGQVIQSYTIEPNYFGEGIAIWGDSIIQLTWQAHRGFVYDKNSFQRLGEFYYSTEGWGITQDGKNLIMSDGTNHLYYLDPHTLAVVHTVDVYDNNGPVSLLNELEYINGKIYANIYTKNIIAIINPVSGLVEAYIDLKGLLSPADRGPGVDVLNGIAYDKKQGRLLVTGKNWPKLFWIELIPKK